MITQDQIRELTGAQLVSTSGEKIGKVGQIFLDDQTGRPEWATVNTGFFGTSESFVPLAAAEFSGDELRVPFDKDKIKNAPKVDVEQGHLSQSEEAELYRYYGMDYSEQRSDSGLPEGGMGTARTGTVDTDTRRDAGYSGVGTSGVGPSGVGTSGTETAGTDDAMTRSEERLRAGTERTTTGKARLRKWVETEEQQVTVPVTKEKARLVTEPVTDANRDDAMSGPDISEDQHEVTLTEERPVVEKEAVPVERVRLEKDVDVEEHQVSEDVRKERIDLDSDTDVDTTRRTDR
jgi:uncharacterized protein (TIGR02271 family)